MRTQNTTDTRTTRRREWSRDESAKVLAMFEQAQQGGTSGRAFAESVGVPRTTLQHGRARKASLDLDPEILDFFEGPVGLAFLHRVLLAVHL